MPTVNDLLFAIYHEKQEAGSRLCAQHALNSLLQESYFTPLYLASLARELDERENEETYGEDRRMRPAGEESFNMDDTGFFSIQVLENALRGFGLNLTNWRSAEMRRFHDKPYTQLGFILNLNEHWFTLRRFGPADPVIDRDPGDGLWFNLNSMSQDPEWVGKTYLGMFLQQAETDGYSVFAVIQAEPSEPLALHRTIADEIATTIPEPTSSSGTQQTSSSSASYIPPMEGFEDEDYELQAALQASLGNTPFYPPAPSSDPPPSLARSGFSALPPSNPASGFQTPTHHPDPPPQLPPVATGSTLLSSTNDDDPDADLAPNPEWWLDPAEEVRREALRRQRQRARAQAAAEQGGANAPPSNPRQRQPAPPPVVAATPDRFFPGQATSSPHSGSGSAGVVLNRFQIPAALEASQRAQQEPLDPIAASAERNRLMLQRMQEEQEHMQRELWEDPAAEARREARRREQEQEAEELRRAIEESEAMAREEGHFTEWEGADRGGGGLASSSGLGPFGGSHDIVYDDGDAELQAALQASLQALPDGWAVPEMPERPPPVRPPPVAAPAPAPIAASASKQSQSDYGDEESVVSEQTEDSSTRPEPPTEALSVDELRKLRLARFGG